MFKNFKEIVKQAKKLGKVTISVAVAQDEEVIHAVKMACDMGFARAKLVGDAALIQTLAQKVGLPGTTEILHESDIDLAALKAVELVRNGEAQVLVKGLINSSNFLKAALNPTLGLRSENILCHMAVFEIPGEKKLSFQSDGGMNIAPNLEEKKQILKNTIDALHKMGIAQPKVAILTANELVNPKMPATLDARALVEMWLAGEFSSSIVEGPIALDVALSAEAAERKGIESQIAGDTDIFILPNIEAGNILGKSLVHYAKAKMAGVVLGATKPIVLVSRSDNAEAKINSIALACLLA